MKRCWTRYIRINSLSQNFKGNLQCPQKSSTNFSHKSNTSNPKLPFRSINTHFCIIFKSVRGSIIGKITRIYDGRSGAQFLTGATKLCFLQNTQTSSSAHPAFKSSYFSGVKVARMDSLSTHNHIEPSSKISGAIPPLILSPSIPRSGTTLFYLNHLPKYISVKRSHPFRSYKGKKFIQFLLLTCTLHDPFISSLLIQLH